MQFKFLVLASLVSLAFGSSTQDILNDLAALTTSVQTLDNGITAFSNPGGTLLQALTIHNDATATQSAIDKTTTDALAVTPNPVSDSDATSVIAAVNVIRPIIEDALTQIVAKKAAFDSLTLGGVPALVKQDLTNLSTSTTNLANALVAATPSGEKSQANALSAEIEAAFAAALAAYANP